jgi:hypothetical protein
MDTLCRSLEESEGITPENVQLLNRAIDVVSQTMFTEIKQENSTITITRNEWRKILNSFSISKWTCLKNIVALLSKVRCLVLSSTYLSILLKYSSINDCKIQSSAELLDRCSAELDIATSEYLPQLFDTIRLILVPLVHNMDSNEVLSMVSIEKQWRFNLLILFLGFLPA